MGYDVEFRPAARRQLGSLPQDVRPRLSEAIQDLARDPRPPGAVAMVGNGGRFRIRVGNYRVVYRVDDEDRRITVERIGHRKDIYR